MQAEPLTADLLRGLPLPEPQAHIDKNTRGTVLIAGGSRLSPGAVTLSGLAAFRAGAGKVLLAVPHSLATAIAVGFPEAGVYGVSETQDGAPQSGVAANEIAVIAENVDAALIGPGFANESAARDLTQDLLEKLTAPALVIDALSLTGLWHQLTPLSRHAGRVVITPHAGEMAQLAQVAKEAVNDDPLHYAIQAARRLECVVVLKGASTVIAQPEGPSYVHNMGVPALATSGSGDVLAGALAGLIARGTSCLHAALWAVYLHAQAGKVLSDQLGEVGLLARELPAEIPRLMRAVRNETHGH